MPTITFDLPEGAANVVAPSGWIEGEHRRQLINTINEEYDLQEMGASRNVWRRPDRWAAWDRENQDWLAEYEAARRGMRRSQQNLAEAERDLSASLEQHANRLYYQSATNTTASTGQYGTWTLADNSTSTPIQTWSTSTATAVEDIRSAWTYISDSAEGITMQIRNAFRSRAWVDRHEWSQVDDRDYITINGTTVQVYQYDVTRNRLLTPNGWLTEACVRDGFTDQEAYQQHRLAEHAERARVARERLAAREEEERQAASRRQEAELRARELLTMFLDSDQLVMFNEHSYFDVQTENSTFRIRAGRVSNVVCIDGEYQGRSFCIHPRDNLPLYDQMLVQKAMLEAEPERFLQVANY